MFYDKSDARESFEAFFRAGKFGGKFGKGGGRFGHDHEHGPGGRGFGRGFMGGGGFPGGRRLGSAELQLVLLALLAEQPAHGYELIRTLEERSGGFYAPSPGMVYPALTYLEEIGHAAVTQDGNRKLYSLTDAGRAHLDANRSEVDAILEMLKRIGARMGDVRDAFAGIGDADPDAADDFAKARFDLKAAIMRKKGCSPDEKRRIAKILANAAIEILKV